MHKISVDMGATNTEKTELASYQLKDVAQTWCNMWQDSRALRRVSVTLNLFKTAFLDRFVPREMREAEFEEFVNLKIGIDDSQGVFHEVCKIIQVCNFSCV